MSEKRKTRSQKAKPLTGGQQTLVHLFSKAQIPSGRSEQQRANVPTGGTGSGALAQPTPEITPFEESTQRSGSQSTNHEAIEITDDESILNDPPSSPQTPGNDTDDAISEGSQHNPITIEPESPKIKVLGSKGVPKPMYSIFVPRATQHASNNWSPSRRSKRVMDVPYPEKDSQHVKGSQTKFHCTESKGLPRRRDRKSAPPTPSPPLGTLLRLCAPPARAQVPHSVAPGIVDKTAYLSTIPHEHLQSHAAIQYLVELIRTGHDNPSDGRLWVDRWRPTKAYHVLGNEANALFLREWMQALALHADTTGNGLPAREDRARNEPRGIKRPHVIRTTSKLKARKKRRIEDSDSDGIDWADVASDPPPWEISDHDVSDLPQVFDSRSSTLGSKPFNDYLTNAILLVGPHGSGKTASVFACAEELGWEVFEVYPGIGKRNGANIDHLVGDVGRNHIVKNTKPSADGRSISRVPRNVFAMECDGVGVAFQRQGDPVATMQEEKGLMDNSATEQPLAPCEEQSDNPPEHNRQPVVQQSIILLEEVDILFKDDVNFWPTVIDFVRNCKRPVIFTCNDTSLVPLDSLPLQTVLTYQPCSPPVAASYLQAICCAEGTQVERESLVKLYESTYEVIPIDLPETSGVSVNGDLPVPDLRRAINNLQMGCVNAADQEQTKCGVHESRDAIDDGSYNWHLVEQSGSPNEEEKGILSACEERIRLEKVSDSADLISFTDSYLVRDSATSSQALALQRVTTADDEIGYKMLGYPSTRDDRGFGLHDRDGDIASFAIRFARGMLERVARGHPLLLANRHPSFRPRALFRARVDHKKWIEQSLRSRLPLGIRTMGHPAIYLDYEGWFRQMVDAEDEREKLHMARLGREARPGRMTRNSQKYERAIEPTVEERHGLEMSRLGER